MPEGTTKVERIQDPQKIITHVVTREGTEKLTPSSNARTSRQSVENGIWTIVEEFVDSSEQTWQGQVDGTIATQPLEMHEIFRDVPTDIKTNWLKWKTGQATTPVDWTPNGVDNAKFQVFYDLYSKGIEVYYAPRITLRANGVEASSPDQSTVGYVDASYAQKIKNLKIGTRDFIMSAARGVQEGDIWRNTYEWLGSDGSGGSDPSRPNGKWDKDIYNPEG